MEKHCETCRCKDIEILSKLLDSARKIHFKRLELEEVLSADIEAFDNALDDILYAAENVCGVKSDSHDGDAFAYTFFDYVFGKDEDKDAIVKKLMDV